MKKMIIFIFAVSGLIGMFGCGSGSSSNASDYATPASGAVSGRNAVTIGTSGGHLVDGNGFTLYDSGSPCTGSCLITWPPVDASQTPSAANGASQAAIGLTSGQVTYNGNLLYYFESDTASGQATGNGVEGFLFVSP